MKRSVTIQDISCFGKCSITVALPIMSAMGIETAIIPTAVLSTHTGGFTGFTFHDLTGEIAPIAAHWKKEGLTFDSIYTGYLGSDEQIHLVSDFFDTFGANALKFVDPVMADNGKFYTGFDGGFAGKMKKLCCKADVVVPNLTEAAFLLEEDFPGKTGYSREYIKETLKKLCDLGAKTAILTGVIFEDSLQGAAAYDSATGEYTEYFGENLPVSFHGTGDCFSAALCGAMTKGLSMYDSLKTAVDFTVASIKQTMDDKRNHWYGVKFEECLGMLTE